jgi:hypothetical protein
VTDDAARAAAVTKAAAVNRGMAIPHNESRQDSPFDRLRAGS